MLGLLGEATAWEFTLQNNALLFSFSVFFYCRLRFLDCSGERFLAKTLKGKQEGKLSSDKLLYFWKYSHFLALNTFFFFFPLSTLLAKHVHNLLCLWICITK